MHKPLPLVLDLKKPVIKWQKDKWLDSYNLKNYKGLMELEQLKKIKQILCLVCRNKD